MTGTKIIWEPEVCRGRTADGYVIEIHNGAASGRTLLKIQPPTGNTLFQGCPNIKNAQSHADTEIDHHRRRGSWTA